MQSRSTPGRQSQLAAIAFLMNETGGPVESPFAQMVLAYTIFTPILAREPRTMGLVLVISMAYYGLLVGFMDPADGVSSEKWAYFCVNGLFAAVPVVIAIVEGRDRARRQREGMQLEEDSADEGSPQFDDDGYAALTEKITRAAPRAPLPDRPDRAATVSAGRGRVARRAVAGRSSRVPRRRSPLLCP